MQSKLSRRTVLAAAAGAAVMCPLSALALSTDQASRLIQGLVEEINGAINAGSSDAQLYRTFERIFAKYADVRIIAQSALGVTARSASASELNAFTDAFSGYIARKYGKRFREFVGGRIEVKSAKAVKSFYEVKTTAFIKGEAPFEVIFLVSDKSGRDLFFNMYIEGVNMLATERTEIGAMLDRRGGDLGKLIEDIKKAG
ncbi:MAG: ABC transporter [Rhodovulum sp.]|nr:ABC transporter [Rhodovulum sp.]|tara:strand:- start:546 stop:1145 length:600 start_codon:yes stop_codon:yes gene_type:complete